MDEMPFVHRLSYVHLIPFYEKNLLRILYIRFTALYCFGGLLNK